MPVNQSSSFQADVEAYIAQSTLPLARRQLVVYQFGDPLELPKGRGVVYQAARWNRVPLPYGPLSEGVPPIGQSMTVTMVSATAVQWGDKITLTDVAEMTIKHPMFKIAKELCALAVAETLERNTFNNLNAGTQVNYVNTRGARASLVTGDVLNLHEINRVTGAMQLVTLELLEAADASSPAAPLDRAEGQGSGNTAPGETPSAHRPPESIDTPANKATKYWNFLPKREEQSVVLHDSMFARGLVD